MHPFKARGQGGHDSTPNRQETAAICSPHPPRAAQACTRHLCSLSSASMLSPGPVRSHSSKAAIGDMREGRLPPSKAQELRINSPPSPLEILPGHALTARSCAGAMAHQSRQVQASPSHTRTPRPGQDLLLTHSSGELRRQPRPRLTQCSFLPLHPVAILPACPQSAPSVGLQQPPHPGPPAPSTPQALLRTGPTPAPVFRSSWL